MSRIAVIGAHGKVARLAVALLVADGHEVTGVIRNPQQAADLEAAGATARVADVQQLSVAELGGVLRGQDTVVWSAGAGGGDPDRTYAVDRDAAIRTMDAAVAGDVRPVRSALSWTILRPSGLTDAEPSGRIETGAGVTASRVSRGNVARMIAVTIEQPDAFAQRVVEFNDGDRPITDLAGK